MEFQVERMVNLEVKVERVKLCKQRILVVNLEPKLGKIMFCKERSLIGFGKLNTEVEGKSRRKGKGEGQNFQL